MAANKISIIVLLSGSGTTLENIIDHIEHHDLPAKISMVISSREDVRGLAVANALGIKTAVVRAKDYRMEYREGEPVGPDWVKMSEAMNKIILPMKPDLICMAGFLCQYVIPPELYGKVMNIHPSLIPAFCGYGMYGLRVHEAVISAGVKITGCTVHFANNHYDKGPIIIQRACKVQDDDNPVKLAQRVYAEECIAYPQAIRLYAEGRLRLLSDSRVKIV